MRRLPFWAALAAAATFAQAFFVSAPRAESAKADDVTLLDKESCVRAYDSAQRLKKVGAYAEAREQLLICGGTQCPAIMHKDCDQWLSEVEASTPTAVFSIHSKADGRTLDAGVSIDGHPVVPLDGRAISFDLGEHELRFTAKNHAPLTRRYTFSEGQKLLQLTVSLEPVTSPTEPRSPGAFAESSDTVPTGVSKSRFTVPVVLSGAVALAGAGGFAYFGLTARQKESELDHCTPNCPQSQIDDTRRQYVFANVSGAVALAGLATALVLVLIEPSAGQSTSTAILRATPDRAASHRLPFQFEF